MITAALTWFGRPYSELRAWMRFCRSYGSCSRQFPLKMSPKQLRKEVSSQRSIPPPDGGRREIISAQSQTAERVSLEERTIDVRRMGVPLHTGMTNAEAVCVHQRSVQVYIRDILAVLDVVQVVQPGGRRKHVLVRTRADLRFCPAGLMINAMAAVARLNDTN